MTPWQTVGWITQPRGGGGARRAWPRPVCSSKLDGAERGAAGGPGLQSFPSLRPDRPCVFNHRPVLCKLSLCRRAGGCCQELLVTGQETAPVLWAGGRGPRDMAPEGRPGPVASSRIARVLSFPIEVGKRGFTGCLILDVGSRRKKTVLRNSSTIQRKYVCRPHTPSGHPEAFSVYRDHIVSRPYSFFRTFY